MQNHVMDFVQSRAEIRQFFQVQVQVQFITHMQLKIIVTMITKFKAAHGEEAHKETTGLIYYEPTQYR